MSLIKKVGRRIPSIRQLHDSRNSLLAERASLISRLSFLEEEAASMRSVIEEKQIQFAALEQETEYMRKARDEDRLIITDYSYDPRQRPLDRMGSGLKLIDRLNSEESKYFSVLQGIARHCDALCRIPRDEQDQITPFWSNEWFPPFDGAALYGLIAEHAPRRYIEVGSGNSTRFARQAVRDLNLDTKIISIDPKPRIEIDMICDEIIRRPMEQVPAAFWTNISPRDLLFVDNSHRSFPNSDVTVFFTEVMPILQSGVIWGLHDIFLPGDYPEAWRGRFYNEQYLLLAYLLGGADNDEIILPLTWVSQHSRLHATLEPLWSNENLFKSSGKHGVGFWMRKGG